MIYTPTVSVDQEDADYLEELRRKYPSKKVPPMNKIIHYTLDFIRKREGEFLKSQKMNKTGGKTDGAVP